MKTNTPQPRSRWLRFACAMLGLVAVLVPSTAESAAREVGDPKTAYISIPEGQQVLHMELLHDHAVVRLGASGDADAKA